MITSAKGSSFLRCALSDSDDNYPKYPRLPVINCAGFSKLSASAREVQDD